MAKQSAKKKAAKTQKIAIHIPQIIIPGTGRVYFKAQEIIDRIRIPDDCIVDVYNPRKHNDFVDHKHIVLTTEEIRSIFPEVWEEAKYN